MVPLDKTPRAQRGNVVFPDYESGLEAPASLLVFHFGLLLLHYVELETGSCFDCALTYLLSS